MTLTNVDLADVDALLLRPPQLTGTLNASAHRQRHHRRAGREGRVHASPKAASSSTSYDSFGGTVRYAGPGLTLDTKLQQNPTTYLTAKGYVPVALFKGRTTAAERAAAHGAPVADGDRIDLHVESTPIDLGLVQGFTTALTKVTGTLQAKIDVTGSAADPHPTGVVTIDKAAFTVEPTGVSYTNLQGKIDLQPDKVHIDHISVLDNHQSALSITGDLGDPRAGGRRRRALRDRQRLQGRSTTSWATSGSTANLEIAGELRAPQIDRRLRHLDRTGQPRRDPRADQRLRLRDASRPST